MNSEVLGTSLSKSFLFMVRGSGVLTLAIGKLWDFIQGVKITRLEPVKVGLSPPQL